MLWQPATQEAEAGLQPAQDVTSCPSPVLANAKVATEEQSYDKEEKL